MLSETAEATSSQMAKPRRFQFGMKALLWGMTVGGALLGVLGIVIERGIELSRIEQAKNNLRQITLALHSYHDTFRGFPTPASTDPAGKPLLSWRVHLLPYLEGDVLYRQFHL